MIIFTLKNHELMILIADSGSTKTTWSLLTVDGPVSCDTAGFNPYYMDASVIGHILTDELDPEIGEAAVSSIHYYGSGCSTENNCNVVARALKEKFPAAEIEVNHDLLAAARALLGRHEGIACILGTGANSCAYDGARITENVPSLGYMFGDEGSGAYIGRRFLTAFLKKDLPKDIIKAFDETYRLSFEDILRAVYSGDNPGGFMASFTRFLSEHEHHDDIREIIFASFTDFFRESVSKYSRYKQVPVSFVGSVAFHFRHILNEAAWQQGISVGRIEQAPMEGLIRYHSQR
jgi:N-acetylglucosamine kinase-like BadF-type ATPase